MKEINGEFCIIVLDKGFVYVGNLSAANGWLCIHNARNIRKWGTQRGLGQLALEGPQPDTVLDDTGIVRAPLHTLMQIIETEEAKWRK